MKIILGELKRLIREALEVEIEAEIEELQREPEFQSVDSFVEMKLDAEEYEYDVVELQALARNFMAGSLAGGKSAAKHYSAPSAGVVDKIKQELSGIGFKFIGREPLRKTRGFTSPVHGKHPGAGMSSGPGIGGGPGAMGGKYTWSSTDKKNLPMGSMKR